MYTLCTKNSVANWGNTFFILGGCIELVAILNLVFLVEYPRLKGIVIREKATILNPGQAEKKNEEDNSDATGDIEDSEEIGAVSFIKALCIPGVLTYALSFFFSKFAFYGIYYWVPTYLREKLGYSKDEAAKITSLGSAGGIIGSITMGLFTDVLNLRSPVHIVCSVIAALCISLITT